MEEYQKQYEIKLREQEEETLIENKHHIEEFIDYSRKFDIKLDTTNFRYHATTGIIVNYPNILSLLCPELIFDKEDLVEVNHLLSLFEKSSRGYGYFENSNFNCSVHEFYKRSYHWRNTNNPRFLKCFLKTVNLKSKYYLGLNKNYLNLNKPDFQVIEADFWYGAKFNEDISTIKNDIVQLKPPILKNKDRVKVIFDDTEVLNIKWSQKGKIKICEIEEIKSKKHKIKFKDNSYYPAKYIHCEFDLEKNEFRHFDGAITLFSEEEYELAVKSDLNYNKKNSILIKPKHVKLFKINGKIDTKDWVDLSLLFMEGQLLLVEYFNGKIPPDILFYLNE